MAKGPKPKGEYVGKSSVFSTRIRPDLRNWLEKAAKQSGRSLSQEVEHRLRRSFLEDEKIADTFGDRQTYRLMRMIADAIHLSESNHHAKAGAWLNESIDFAIARGAAMSVLDAVDPRDDVDDPDVLDSVSLVGGIYAAKVWSDVQNAKASIQLNEGSDGDHLNSVTQSDLGPGLIKRVSPSFYETARNKLEKARKRVEGIELVLGAEEEERGKKK